MLLLFLPHLAAVVMAAAQITEQNCPVTLLLNIDGSLWNIAGVASPSFPLYQDLTSATNQRVKYCRVR